MTGPPAWQVTELVAGVCALLGTWQRPRGRRRALGMYRAVVLTLFLLRHDNGQDVAGELFGCSQATVSRVFRRIRPLLAQVTAARAVEVASQARRSAVLIDGFITPTGERAAVERAISHLTNWKILDIGYRGRLSEFPDVLRTVTNLEIYRIWA